MRAGEIKLILRGVSITVFEVIGGLAGNLVSLHSHNEVDARGKACEIK